MSDYTEIVGKREEVDLTRGPTGMVGLNDIVVWYTDADVNHPGDFGFVSEVGTETLTIVTTTHTGGVKVRPSVRHAKDGRLKVNEELRKDGCWDFHPLTKRWAALESRMGELEAMVSDFVAPEAPEKRKPGRPKKTESQD